MNPLPADDLARALQTLEGWRAEGDAWIARDLAFADYDEAMDFIVRLADVARTLDHHPNLSNVYNRVELRLQTHDAGGVTEKDLEFAARANALLAAE